MGCLAYWRFAFFLVCSGHKPAFVFISDLCEQCILDGVQRHHSEYGHNETVLKRVIKVILIIYNVFLNRIVLPINTVL